MQEYNRDLSILAIRTWSEQRQKDRAAQWEKAVRKKWAREKGKRKAETGTDEAEPGPTKKSKAEDGSAVPSEGTKESKVGDNTSVPYEGTENAISLLDEVLLAFR